jgi:hypothetical protein
MANVSIQAQKGGALLLVNPDGSSNVWEIPEGATISIEGQRGFGDANQVLGNVSAAEAMTNAGTLITHSGAV